jgi:WD40 repeat protein
VQVGHRNLNAVAFAPDGRRVLTAGDDGTGRLWETETGRFIRSFSGHTKVLHAAAFSADGRQVLTGGDDGAARLWDADTGKSLGVLVGHGLPVLAVAFIPKSGRVLTSGADGTARVWNVGTGDQLATLQGHVGAVTSVAASDDGKQALTGGVDGTVRVWDLQTSKQDRGLEGGDSGAVVRAVAFASGGKRVVAGGDDGALRVWDITSGKLVRVIPTHVGWVLAVAASSDGRFLLTAGRGPDAELWDAEGGALVRTLATGAKLVYSVAFSTDGRRALTGGDDGAAGLWDVATGHRDRRVGGSALPVSSIAVRGDGLRILTGSYFGWLSIWNGVTGALERATKVSPAGVHSVAFSPDGLRAVAGCDDGVALILDLVGNTPPRSINAHAGVVASVAFSPDGARLATGGADGTARIWDTSGLQKLVLHAHPKAIKFDPSLVVHAVVFSPDSKRLLTGGMDGSARLWDIGTRKQVAAFDGHTGTVNAVAFAPDGARIATGDDAGVARIWDVVSKQVYQTFPVHQGGVAAVAFSPPDGRVLMTGGEDGLARLCDVASGRAFATLEGHQAVVHAVAFAPNGRRAITGSYDGTMRLWTTATGDPLCTIVGFKDGNWAVTDSKGRFDAPNQGDIEGLHWVVGRSAYNLTQLRKGYHEPNLFAKHLGLCNEAMRNVLALDRVKPPPEVAVVSPAAGDARGVLQIVLTDVGGGIGSVVVKVNDIEVIADARAVSRDTDARQEVVHLDVPIATDPRLVPGTGNVLSVEAFGADGVIPRGGEVKYFAPGLAPPADPDIWAVVVGTADYDGKEIDLRFAGKDAEAFGQALALAAGRMLREKAVLHITTLTTEVNDPATKPTKKNIVNALKLAQQARPSDALVVYFSGHGIVPPGADEYFYLTADAQSLDLSGAGVRDLAALSGTEIADCLRLVRANKRVFIFDTCAAGGVVPRLTESRLPPGSQVRALERLRSRAGSHMLLGSAADAVSYEATRYAQGLLTYSLLLGMTGPGLKDDQVDVATWFEYASDEVETLARGLGGVQKPIYNRPNGGASFPVGLITAHERKLLRLAKAHSLVLRANVQYRGPGIDPLDLASRIDRAQQTRNGDADPVFVDAQQGEDAYQLKVGYRIDDGTIAADVQVFFGRTPVGNTLSAKAPESDPDALAQRIVDSTNKLFVVPLSPVPIPSRK